MGDRRRCGRPRSTTLGHPTTPERCGRSMGVSKPLVCLAFTEPEYGSLHDMICLSSTFETRWRTNDHRRRRPAEIRSLGDGFRRTNRQADATAAPIAIPVPVIGSAPVKQPLGCRPTRGKKEGARRRAAPSELVSAPANRRECAGLAPHGSGLAQGHPGGTIRFLEAADRGTRGTAVSV